MLFSENIYIPISLSISAAKLKPSTEVNKMGFTTSFLFLVALVGMIVIHRSQAVTIDMDTSEARDLDKFGSLVKKTMEEWYPVVEQLLYSPTHREIDRIRVKIYPQNGGVAGADSFGNYIGANANFFRQRPDDVGAFVHEMAHVIQKYRDCPGWITEGIADWVRRWYYEPSQGRARPGKPNQNQNKDSNPVPFHQWLNNKYPGIMYWLNRDCREGKGQNAVEQRIVKMTGKSSDENWNEMMRTWN